MREEEDGRHPLPQRVLACSAPWYWTARGALSGDAWHMAPSPLWGAHCLGELSNNSRCVTPVCETRTHRTHQPCVHTRTHTTTRLLARSPISSAHSLHSLAHAHTRERLRLKCALVWLCEFDALQQLQVEALLAHAPLPDGEGTLRQAWRLARPDDEDNMDYIGLGVMLGACAFSHRPADVAETSLSPLFRVNCLMNSDSSAAWCQKHVMDCRREGQELAS